MAEIRLDLENIAQLDQSYEEEKPQTDEMYWDCEPSFIQSGDPFQCPCQTLDSLMMAFKPIIKVQVSLVAAS